MSVAIAYHGYPVLTPTSGWYGVSDDSETLQRSIEKVFRDATKSISEQRFDYLRRSLLECFVRCSKANWDGYNATPISESAFFEATKLLELLPSYLPLPDITPEPTGEIGLEWYKGSHFTFVASVRGNNVLSYAGLFGPGNETYGTENFTESLPRTIIENVRRLFPQMV